MDAVNSAIEQYRKALKERRSTVKRLIKEGKTQSEVARELGISRQRVHQILQEVLASGN
jgi:DNA invertase Pin-like site-specific DNA recombinase